jgi:hypothetical protein
MYQPMIMIIWLPMDYVGSEISYVLLLLEDYMVIIRFFIYLLQVFKIMSQDLLQETYFRSFKK